MCFPIKTCEPFREAADHRIAEIITGFQLSSARWQQAEEQSMRTGDHREERPVAFPASCSYLGSGQTWLWAVAAQDGQQNQRFTEWQNQPHCWAESHLYHSPSAAPRPQQALLQTECLDNAKSKLFASAQQAGKKDWVSQVKNFPWKMLEPCFLSDNDCSDPHPPNYSSNAPGS